MLCDYCGKNQATALFKQSINGKTQHLHICDECANAMLYQNIFSDFSINEIFSKSLFSGGYSNSKVQKVCDKCQSTLDEVMNTGKVGCDQCYCVFGNELLRTIEKIHGKSNHVGKVPESAQGTRRLRNQITEYKVQLNQMIAEQDFEQAAILRDKIRQLESGVNRHE